MIGFWKQSDGNARTSVKGLSFEQKEWLQSCPEGGRFILLMNPKKSSPSAPDFLLQIVGQPQNKETP